MREDQADFAKKGEPEDARGSNKALKISDVKDHEKNLLDDKDLTFGCSIKLSLPKPSNCGLQRNLKKRKLLSESAAEFFNLEKPEGLPSFEKMSDFTIVCGKENKEPLRCSKLILSLRSSVFEEMFAHTNTQNGLDAQERTTRARKLSTKGLATNSKAVQNDTKDAVYVDEEPEIMRTVLQFAYTDLIEDNMINTKLLLAADKYEIHGLQDICEQHLATHLTLENIFEIAAETFQVGSRNYQQALANFISQHWTSVQVADNFYRIKQQSDLLVKIISLLKLNMHVSE